MSMMGCFRELPGSLLARLQDDPSLVDELVMPRAMAPADLHERVAAAVDQMKTSIAESGDQFLPLLPPEQRSAIAALAPQQRTEVFKQMAELLAKVQWDDMAGRSSKQSRLSGQDLGPLLEIDKAWHGLHYLLTQCAEEAPGALGQAVLGGTEIGENGGYGPARYLRPHEVAAVSDALRAMPPEVLRSRYDAAALAAANVYPGGWEDLENLEWLLEAFESVRSFYERAASRGAAALLFIS